MSGRRLLVLAVSALSATTCLSQGNMTIQNRAVKSQKLAGIVMAADQPVQNVHVEECDEDWRRVLTSTITDANGHFQLTPVGKGPIHYLRIYAPGLDISEYPVKLSKLAHAELQLTVKPGT
jgi:hypothetical protein